MVDDRLRILIDTNVFIAAESDSIPRHPRGELASEFLKLATKLGHSVCLAATIGDDFRRHADPNHRLSRRWQTERYDMLHKIDMPSEFPKRAGYMPSAGPSARVDMSLLQALERNAAHWWISDDQGLQSHASTLSLSERTFSLVDAVEALRQQDSTPIDVPAVREIEGYELDVSDPIFDDFDEQYRIREWVLTKVAPERRTCLVVGDTGELASLVILKEETADRWGLPGRVLKICTFKVSEEARGAKRGELLLWAIFQYARRNRFDSAFVEVFEHEKAVTSLFSAFGFSDRGETNRENERIYGKILTPDRQNRPTHPLEYNILYGPGALLPTRFFLVPIKPGYHASLLPVAESQLSLMPGATDHGNAIRKAYLCRSSTRQLRPGDTLLFLRSETEEALAAVGVVERTLVSRDTSELLMFSGRRTIYPPAQIIEKTKEGEVLAVQFRLDRVLESPIDRSELRRRQVMKGSPQSITQVTDSGACEWLKAQLAD